MSNKDFEINIAHLYPDLLNSNGDVGNICALKKRLEWRNIKVNITNIFQNDNIDFSKYDIYFIGGSNSKEQIIASDKLSNYANSFQEITGNGKVILGISGGYQLLGKYIEEENGNKIKGLGILDAYTIIGSKRYSGNVKIKTDFLTPDTIFGFENHNGLTYILNETKALGKIITGYGNNLTSREEGARYKNVFGSYLHGALLPKNPAFCDYLLQCAIRQKTNNNDFMLPPINDNLENLTRLELTKISY